MSTVQLWGLSIGLSGATFVAVLYALYLLRTIVPALTGQNNRIARLEREAGLFGGGR